MGASGIPFAIWLLERIAVGEALMLQLLVLHGGLPGSPDIPAAAAVRIVFSIYHLSCVQAAISTVYPVSVNHVYLLSTG